MVDKYFWYDLQAEWKVSRIFCHHLYLQVTEEHASNLHSGNKLRYDELTVLDGTRIVNVTLSLVFNIYSMKLVFQDSGAGLMPVWSWLTYPPQMFGMISDWMAQMWYDEDRGLLSPSVQLTVHFFSFACLPDKPINFYGLQTFFLARLTQLLISWSSPPLQRGAFTTSFRVMLPPPS